MPLYVQPDEAESYLRSTVAADFEEITAALTVACSAIDRHCLRTFAVPTGATTRTFVVDSGHLVKIDDIANTTDLVVVDDGSTVAAADFQLETSPGRANQVGRDGLTRPFCYIRRTSGSWHTDSFGEATLAITARYGWPAVPDDVKLAAKMLAKDFLNMRDTRFGIVQVGDFSRRLGDNYAVTALLSPYRAAEAWGIA